MVLKVEPCSAANAFIVQARFTCCHNTVPTSTALSDTMENYLQTGIKNLWPTLWHTSNIKGS